MRLILASASEFKRAQLERLGLSFEAIDACVDESPLPDEAPEALCRRLSELKACAIAAHHPGAFVLGGDQVVSLNGEVLHKPGTRERAIAQLELLQGHVHDIFCGVALTEPSGQVSSEVVHVRMAMRELSRARIERYVERDDVLRSAGSYTIEAGGIGLFRRMQCDDYTAIIGLPLTRAMDLLERAGALEPIRGDEEQARR